MNATPCHLPQQAQHPHKSHSGNNNCATQRTTVGLELGQPAGQLLGLIAQHGMGVGQAGLLWVGAAR